MPCYHVNKWGLSEPSVATNILPADLVKGWFAVQPDYRTETDGFAYP